MLGFITYQTCYPDRDRALMPNVASEMKNSNTRYGFEPDVRQQVRESCRRFLRVVIDDEYLSRSIDISEGMVQQGK